MIKFGVIFVAVLALAHGKSLNAEEAVQVQVYYEVLCPDSIAFITNQLYPAFTSLGSEKVKLELIPYGHATEQDFNGTKAFTCQHGPEECYGNKIHACAINLSKSVEISTEFVFCSEGSDDPSADVALKGCAEKVGISWTDIQECATNGKGDDLLSGYGEETDLVDPVFVPTIVLDGTFNQKNQDKSLVNFKVLVCGLLGYPEQCSPRVQVYYETLCPDSIAFINAQLYPAFQTLGSDKIKLELIPYGLATEDDSKGFKDFTCQHGPRECYGNRVHACAISLSKSVNSSVEFVNCSEGSEDPAGDEALIGCASKANISWIDIQKCVSTGKSDDLLSKYGKQTDLIKPKFIPTIVFDGKFSQQTQDDSLSKFKALICDLIGNPKECK